MIKKLSVYACFRLCVALFACVVYVLSQYGYMEVSFLNCLIISTSPTLGFFIVFLTRNVFFFIEAIMNILLDV